MVKGGSKDGGRKGGSGGGGAPSASMPCALKFLVPEAMAAAIIGKGGAVIAAMRTSCSAQLGLTGQGEVYPSTDSRVLTAQAGTEENLNELIKQIIAKLSELVQGQSNAADAIGVEGDLKLKTLVPRAAVGGVIGKGGATIKQLRQQSGAKITINEPVGSGPSAEQLVAVSGEAEALESVLLSVNKQIQLVNEEPWFAAWATSTSTVQAGGYPGASSSYAGGGYGGGAGGYLSHNPGIQKMMQVANSLPPYVMEDSRGFAMSCVVPQGMVGGLIGRSGAGTKEVQMLTGAKISIRDIPEDPDNRSLNITGPLSATCTAYMLMMRRYLDAEAQASTPSSRG